MSDWPQYIEQAVEDIDAAIFTGDHFDKNPVWREEMRLMLQRWERGLAVKFIDGYGVKGKLFITFGQKHAHHINGKTVDRNCVAVIKAENADDANRMAFDWMDGKFHGHTWEEMPDMWYYPNGLVELN